jgi:hypothetical protein
MMKQPFAGSSNVAWFKLAEFVSRGEKERTLSMYRLLAHSFDDPALIKQLEGDLLLTFKDEAGYTSYEEAARLYLANNKTLQAIALYEYLMAAFPAHELYRERLLDLYRVVDDYDRIVMLSCRYVLELDQHTQKERICRCLESLHQEIVNKKLSAHILQELSLTLLKTNLVDKEITLAWSLKAANALTETGQLSGFLEMVKVLNESLYNALVEQL